MLVIHTAPAHYLPHVVQPVRLDHLIGFVDDRVPEFVSFLYFEYTTPTLLHTAQREQMPTLHEIY